MGYLKVSSNGDKRSGDVFAQEVEHRVLIASQFANSNKYSKAREVYGEAEKYCRQQGDFAEAARMSRLAAAVGMKDPKLNPRKAELRTFDLGLFDLSPAMRTVGVFMVLLGVVFTIPSITGNVIGETSFERGLLSLVVILIGIILIAVYTKRKKAKVGKKLVKRKR